MRGVIIMWITMIVTFIIGAALLLMFLHLLDFQPPLNY